VNSGAGERESGGVGATSILDSGVTPRSRAASGISAAPAPGSPAARRVSDAAVLFGSAASPGLAAVRRWLDEQGWTPFAFQEETWRRYLAGESGLIHAATGTGKTYAIWLAALAEALDERAAGGAADAGLRLLWITPLRALANDLVGALRAPRAALGLRDWAVEARTGDTAGSLKLRQRDRPPTALVTTPESLAVLLSYPESRALLGGVRTVVVDEWHELLGSKRGSQLELALARLRAWSPGLRTWGLSATLANLDEAARALLGARGPAGEVATPAIVSGDVAKDYAIDTIVPAEIARFPWAGHLGLRLVPEVLEAIEGARSTLLFTNVRSQAEAWYQAIRTFRPDWGDTVALHHGSIDRKIREQVEEDLRRGKLRCVVCTSSLDLGVDFTPVDQVVQIGSPKGIARLLQRAGRSGHRPGESSRVVCVPTHAFELVEFAAARVAMAERVVEPRRPLDRPLDVLVQHLVTIALGGGFEERALYDEVRTTIAFEHLDPGEWRWALDFVTRGGPALRAYPQYARLRERDGWFHAASPQVARLHRLSIGTIVGDPVMQLRFLGGRRLGTIEESFIARLRPGDRFVFAGRVLRLVRVRDMTALVRLAPGSKGEFPRWYGARLSFSTQLGEAVKRMLAEGSGVKERTSGRVDDGGRGIPDEAPTPAGAGARPEVEPSAQAGCHTEALEAEDAELIHSSTPPLLHSAVPRELQAVQPLLALQRRWSQLPRPGALLLERTGSRDGHHAYFYPFEGRAVHEGLSALLAYRLARQAPRSITVTSNDYGFELLSAQPLPDGEPKWRALLSPAHLVDDLLASLNAAELDRRQFREIARVAGLVFPGYPGMPRSARQLQASSGLMYDVFVRYDPSNLLLAQARREVLDRQLEIARIRQALERMTAQELVIVPTERLTPLAFPLWADRIQAAHVSTEKWTDRVRRMAAALEKAAARGMVSSRSHASRPALTERKSGGAEEWTKLPPERAPRSGGSRAGRVRRQPEGARARSSTPPLIHSSTPTAPTIAPVQPEGSGRNSA